MINPLIIFSVIGLLCLSPKNHAENAIIAVASNFKTPLQLLIHDFQQQQPEHKLIVSSASTGILFNQIKHGARFDLLLAADEQRPLRLEQLGLGVAKSRFTYAKGQLALASNYLEPIQFNKKALGDLLLNSKGKIAIANPRLAPYGLASQQVLAHLQIWEPIQPRLVRASNITQSYQFVSSGNATAGFINLATAKHHKNLNDDLKSWPIPPQWHKPIRQQAILLQSGKKNTAARSFMRYLRSPSAVHIIRQQGYLVDYRK